MAAAVALLLWWLAAAPRPPAPSAPTASDVVLSNHAVPPVAEPAITPAAVAGGAPPEADIGPAPPGLSSAQWAALAAELAHRPDAGAERARLRAYLTWSDTVARWRAAPGDRALAQSVYDGLPDRLAQREVSAPEARVLAAAVLPVLEPDTARQAQVLQALEQTLPPAAAPSAQQQAFLREQAAVVAAWRTTPVGARDPAALQARLDALRAQHFAAERPATSIPTMSPQEVSR